MHLLADISAPRFELKERPQIFIGAHNVTLSHRRDARQQSRSFATLQSTAKTCCVLRQSIAQEILRVCEMSVFESFR